MRRGGPQLEVDSVGGVRPPGLQTLVGAETLGVNGINASNLAHITWAWLNNCTLTSVSDSLGRKMSYREERT